MAHASSFCPFCHEEFISMSSSVLCRQRRLRHIAVNHPEEEFEDAFLEAKGEEHRSQHIDTPLRG